MTPRLTGVPPPARIPAASRASIQPPDSRVSRPQAMRGDPPISSARAAPRRAMVAASSGGVPGTPRTPSVPNMGLDMKAAEGSGQRSVTLTRDGSMRVTPISAFDSTVTGRL